MELAEDGVTAIGEAFEQAVLLAVRHLFDREGLSLTASDVLHRLDAGGPARLTALAAAVQVSQPSMTELIKRLERRGLVVREQDPADRRVTLVAITDTAQAFMSRQQAKARTRLGALLATLPTEDQAALRLAIQVAAPILGRLNSSAARQSGRWSG